MILIWLHHSCYLPNFRFGRFFSIVLWILTSTTDAVGFCFSWDLMAGGFSNLHSVLEARSDLLNYPDRRFLPGSRSLLLAFKDMTATSSAVFQVIFLPAGFIMRTSISQMQRQPSCALYPVSLTVAGFDDLFWAYQTRWLIRPNLSLKLEDNDAFKRADRETVLFL